MASDRSRGPRARYGSDPVGIELGTEREGRRADEAVLRFPRIPPLRPRRIDNRAPLSNARRQVGHGVQRPKVRVQKFVSVTVVFIRSRKEAPPGVIAAVDRKSGVATDFTIGVDFSPPEIKRVLQ